MPLYTFYPRQTDGNSLSFESHELADDEAAETFAATVLQQHPTCERVAVWNADREVCSRRRPEPRL